jgi:hypothetical protein
MRLCWIKNMAILEVLFKVVHQSENDFAIVEFKEVTRADIVFG